MKKFFAILSIALAGAVFAQDDYLAEEYIADVSEISQPSEVVESSAAVEEESSSSAEDTVAAESSSSADIIGENDYDNMFGSEGSLNGDKTEEVEAPSAGSVFDDDSIPELKRCKYTFRSWGIGFSTWHNWRNEEMNPERDWALALLVHHGRIWEMTSHGSITFVMNANFAFGDYFETQAIGVLGGRYFFLNDIYSPYIGGGFGLGLQYDGYLNEYSKSTFGDKFGFGFVANFEAGIVVFRTTTTQLELGASYDVLVNVLKMEPTAHVYGAFNFYLAINY